MSNNILDLYTDYLMISTSLVSSTGLSKILDEQISHDKITRFLSSKDFTSKELWNKVKPVVRKLESDEGLLILDDSVEEKAFSRENDIICWHYDHSVNRVVKGVNQLTLIYHTKGVTIPICLDFVRKTEIVFDKKKGRDIRVSKITKNEQYRQMLITADMNKIKFSYILNDSWFASSENMKFIDEKLEKKFVMSVKSNRKVCLSMEDKKTKNYISIENLDLKEATEVYIEGLNFSLKLCKKILKDKNNKEVAIYLMTNDLNLDKDKMFEIYQKRWNIETFYKSMKSNCSYSKSPTHTVRTQCNHFFCSVYAVFKYEMIRLNTNLNHFALKSKIYLNALKIAMNELQVFKSLDNFSYA
ncbi:MAG: hypothetical protein KatS3mg068_1991 [Candidatus Sericytochromatia bacterium]|nr:MAG: hypothetical protein KatS3mg068_1691 [Candidatus Sericytochromatia bacterium]GIW22984.1 MAG: hypothetical protein KatS3mg068_1991 [Candidatus Sericytochromatia bacterium]